MNKDFLWGGSTSAFQFEGGGRLGGKGASIYDTREAKTGVTYSIASDFYHHYHEDIRLMKEMGFKAFRMSIAWTRIYPNGIEEEPNQEGIAFYKDVFQELKANGIEPVVTLFHWDMPQYLVDHYNGFYSRETVDFFAKYARTCFEEFGPYVKNWLTLNENNLSMLIPWMYLNKESEVAKKEPKQLAWDCYYNSLLCHFLAVKLCHELVPGAKIGNMTASAFAYPLTPKPTDVFAAQKHNQETMWDDLDILTTGQISESLVKRLADKGVKVKSSPADQALMADPLAKIDFISFSYYFSLCMQDKDQPADSKAETMQMLYQAYYNPYLEKTDFGWQIDPRGLRIFMNELYSRYYLPVMVVENGCGVECDKLEDGKVHDDYRIDYLRQHIAEVVKTVDEDHVPVLGYLPWGCIDLYSASGNKDKRYGFIYVDFDHQLKRYKKDSFAWYKQVIASNGKELG